MSRDNQNEDIISGITERRIEVVRVGRRIAESGVIKTASYEESMTQEGVLERISTIELHRLDCEQVARDMEGR